ncbi:MAG: PaaI family thioesterase [Gammaproteobacteria bacterium]|nr:PaaI family thioesterase [Gammaproteobacteria bacterium]
MSTPDAGARRVASASHLGCLICGDPRHNPHSLQLAFVVGEDGSVQGDFTASARHQGYNGLLHGGITSTLLDAAMTHCLFAAGVQALTAELVVRFVAPIAIGDQVRICARLLTSRRNLHRLEAEILRGNRTMAHGTATFITAADGVVAAASV